MYETELSYKTMNYLNCFQNNKKVKNGLISVQKIHKSNMNNNYNNDNQNNNTKSKINNNKIKTSKANYFSSEKKKLATSRITQNRNPKNNNNYMTIPTRIKLFRTTTNFYKNKNIKKNKNDIKNKNNEEEKNANIKNEYSIIGNEKPTKNLEIEK